MRTISSILLLAAALALGACHRDGETQHGGSVAVIDPVTIPWPLLAIVDPASVGIMHVDVAAARATGRLDAVLPQVALHLVAGDDTQRQAALAIVNATDEAVIASSRIDVPAQPFIVAARGMYPSDMLARMVAGSDRFTAAERGPFVVYRGPITTLVQVGTHTFLVGTHAEVEGALDRMLAGRPVDALDGGRLSAMADRIGMDASHVGFVLALDPASLRAVGIELPESVAAVVRGVRGRMDFASGIDVAATVLTADAAGAQGVADVANRMLGRVRSIPMLRMMGFGDVFDALQIQVRGTDLELRYALPAARVDLLLQQLQGIMQMMGSRD